MFNQNARAMLLSAWTVAGFSLYFERFLKYGKQLWTHCVTSSGYMERSSKFIRELGWRLVKPLLFNALSCQPLHASHPLISPGSHFKMDSLNGISIALQYAKETNKEILLFTFTTVILFLPSAI